MQTIDELKGNEALVHFMSYPLIFGLDICLPIHSHKPLFLRNGFGFIRKQIYGSNKGLRKATALPPRA